LLALGWSHNRVSAELGVSRAAVREWQQRGIEPLRPSECPLPLPADRWAAYAELLGFYLGDGCISRQRRTYSLRVTCDAVYPEIIERVGDLIVTVRGRGPVSRVPAPGCVVVQGYWNHWPCLFPQHGPGKKHQRTLELAPWQAVVVAEHPGPFLRGLFHSDGSRFSNSATREVDGGRTRYTYSRWQLVNHSDDILRFACEALDLLGVPWRRSSWKTVSVSRREAVAVLDEVVGPKR
jgi:hypothetical protein